MKRRVGTVYRFERNGYDIALPQHCKDAVDGQLVRVIRMRGAPAPGTMGMYHIEDAKSGVFIGMCDGKSLKPKEA